MQIVITILYALSTYAFYFFNYSPNEKLTESGTERDDDAGNIIKLAFVDESSIPNMGVGEANIVSDTDKTKNISEINVNDVNDGHTKTQTYKSTFASAVRPKPNRSDKTYNSHDTLDLENKLPPFTPNRRPGIYYSAYTFTPKLKHL